MVGADQSDDNASCGAAVGWSPVRRVWQRPWVRVSRELQLPRELFRALRPDDRAGVGLAEQAVDRNVRREARYRDASIAERVEERFGELEQPAVEECEEASHRYGEAAKVGVQAERCDQQENIDEAVREVDIGKRHARCELVGDRHARAAQVAALLECELLEASIAYQDALLLCRRDASCNPLEHDKVPSRRRQPQVHERLILAGGEQAARAQPREPGRHTIDPVKRQQQTNRSERYRRILSDLLPVA
mmetsp:Transcript_25838/g.64090  ORF Transcript_25838/g.64090 Transcript_25838/m.64090 type:complete len:248 (-) Transcript_25838:841-1584(-)